MECQVCCERLNKSDHSRVSCGYCEFIQCSSCAEKYLLDTPNDPHCMNCKTGWNRDRLNVNFSKKFVNKTFKQRRENLLFERERALMPATQPLAEIRSKIRTIEKKMEADTNECTLCMIRFNNVCNELHSGRTMSDEERLAIYERALKERETEDVYRRRTLYNNYHLNLLRAGPKQNGPKREFIRACPANDCRGFLSTAWKCGMCEVNVCAQCHEIKEKDAEHTCKPENVETAKLLSKDTRGCPKCASLIFKIDGCFAENTPVLSWNGSTIMSQNVKIGDVLVGDDGYPRTVTDLCNGQDDMYKILQKNGTDYTVNSKHKLILKFCGDGKVDKNMKMKWFDTNELRVKTKNLTEMEERDEQIIEMTVSDYMILKDSTKKHMMGFKSAGINWPKKDVHLDPYLLGLWLGDGFSNGVDFASNDPEIQEYLYDWCKDQGAELVHTDAYRFHIRRQKGTLPAVGSDDCKGCKKKVAWICEQNVDEFEQSVLKNHPLKKWTDYYDITNNKHIPPDYLMNDRECRLAVLAGIIDTDGHVSNNGKRVSIIQSKEHISKQVELLSRSLGFVTTIRTVERNNVKVPGTDEIKNYGNHYIVNISGTELGDIPTRVVRKKCVSSEPNKDWMRTSLSVEYVGKGNYYGWTVDGNHRFVGPDLTVLRNCDQMYCTACNTAFSWKSGKIEVGRIHNPHYYDYLRRVNNGNIPREQGDTPHNPCGGMPRAETIQAILRNLGQAREFNHMMTIVQQFFHADYYIVPRYRPNPADMNNEEMRILYMIGDLDEEKFKKELQKKEKKRQKNQEIHDIFTTFMTVTREQMQRISSVPGEVQRIDDELRVLREYINDEMKKVSKCYNCVVPWITDTWIFSTLNYNKVV